MDYQKLFDYMVKEYGIDLLETEMQEIVDVVNEMQSTCIECDGTGKWKENEIDKEINCPKCSAPKKIYIK